MGVATHTYKCDDHYPFCSELHYGCLLVLRSMHVATLCGVFFLLLSVHSSLNEVELNNLIRGGFGSTWGHNFYMGMLNGSNLFHDGDC